ncbi:ECF transporter S component [Eubacterium sp.]
MKKAFLYITVALSLAFIVLWQFLFADSVNYYIVSVVILIASMLPFFVSYEQKKVTARDITLTATLIAIAVVSRAAFYLVPQVKPIAAVVIVSAVCLGAHKGYIVGAFSAFVSNFIFGQGMWTPFQMVALGTVGLLAGLIFRWLKVNRYTLSIVGFVLATVVYGAIVDMSTVLSAYGNNVTFKGALSIYASGAVFSLVFGGATAVFLFLFGMPFITKIERISKKYGLI